MKAGFEEKARDQDLENLISTQKARCSWGAEFGFSYNDILTLAPVWPNSNPPQPQFWTNLWNEFYNGVFTWLSRSKVNQNNKRMLIGFFYCILDQYVPDKDQSINPPLYPTDDTISQSRPTLSLDSMLWDNRFDLRPVNKLHIKLKLSFLFIRLLGGRRRTWSWEWAPSFDGHLATRFIFVYPCQQERLVRGKRP